jgi:alkylation response protein AidB-like acyl-CoA dehydrogenase
MGTELSEVHDELRSVARELLAKADPGVRLDRRRLAAPGWLGLEVPEALDGAGVTFAETAVVLVELGRAATSSPYLGSAVLGVGTLSALRAGSGRDELLGRIASGGVLVAAALAEDADGCAVRVPFRIERSGGRQLVHGRAAFVPDALDAGRLLLLALDPDGTPAVVAVDPRLPGIDLADQPVLDATRRFAVVRAEGAEIGEESVWRFAGSPEAAVRLLLDRAAVAVACDSLGLSEAMLEASVGYAGVRTQFGCPIGSFQAVKHACADMLVRVSVARQLVSAAVQALADHDPDAGVAVSMAKSYACGAAVEVVGKAMQLHGGIGYTWERGIHAYLKRATLNRALFGSPAAHRARLAERYR